MPCNILTESKSKYITADLSSGKGHTVISRKFSYKVINKQS